MHTYLAETNQPGGNVVNVIPAHDFGKPYDGVENVRSAWLVRNTKETIGTYIASIYTSISSSFDHQQHNYSHFLQFIKSLEFEITQGNKILEEDEQEHGIPKTSNDEVNIILNKLKENRQHLEKKLDIFFHQQSSADAVLSTISAENKQETT